MVALDGLGFLVAGLMAQASWLPWLCPLLMFQSFSCTDVTLTMQGPTCYCCQTTLVLKQTPLNFQQFIQAASTAIPCRRQW